MEKLFSDEIGTIGAALAKAQLVMETAKKTADNPFFRSKYANLDEVVKVIKQPLHDNKIAFTQLLNGVKVVTMLIHESGQWIAGEQDANPIPDKQGVITPQALGSAITYARRYGLMAICGIATEDDDGNAATNPKEKKDDGKNGVDTNKPAPDVMPRRPLPDKPGFIQTLVLLDDQNKIDWLDFGKAMGLAIRNSKTAEELKKWEVGNAGNLAQMATEAPQIFARIDQGFVKVRKELEAKAAGPASVDDDEIPF